MKAGKLYIKISLSFLALFFLSLMVIFSLFIISPGRHFTTRLEENNKAIALLVKQTIEDRIRAKSNMDLSENKPLIELIKNLSKILGAEVWLNYPDGTLAIKSFSGGIPSVGDFKKWYKSRDYGSYEFYHNQHAGFYAVMPIAFPDGETGSIHVLVKKWKNPSPEKGFAFGLLIIGVVIALLIIPLSRYVIKPLKDLNESALQIADGDLSHRANVRSKDEIGQLCRSFNYMANKLESMILSGKELTANVSHELRSPLTRIRVAEEMLRDKLEQGYVSDWRKHLDEIREDIAELDSIIEQILKLSKLDIRETPLTILPFDINELIDDILEKLKPVIEQKSLHVLQESVFDSHFTGDKEYMRTALVNILDNAIKFTSANGEIRILTASEDDNLIISIVNTHDPLEEEELSKIFDPFHRAKHTKAGGTGLGLAIVKKIIERHGGSIEALNTAQGLEIRLTLSMKDPPK